MDVDDVAAGHVAAETKGRIGERYLLGNHNITFREFVEIVCRVAGKPAPKITIPNWLGLGVTAGLELVSNHITHAEPRATVKSAKYMFGPAYFDSSKARAELDLPCTPLVETIERAVSFYRSQNMSV